MKKNKTNGTTSLPVDSANDELHGKLLKIAEGLHIHLTDFLKVKSKEKEILAAFLNSEVQNFNNPEETFQKLDLTYELHIVEGVSGRVFLNINREVAEKIAAELFGEDFTESPAENTDYAMQELLNIFAGNLATSLTEHNISIDIGVPSVSTYDFTKKMNVKRVLFRFTYQMAKIQFILEVDK